MRYFLFFFYATQNSLGGFRERTGQINFSHETFPSNKQIKDAIQKHFVLYGYEIVLTGLHEFKTEEDYNNFKSE